MRNFPNAWAAVLFSAVLIAGCSSAIQPSVPGPGGQSPAGAQTTAVAPVVLDLCRPPDLPPAELRSKPGYAEFAVTVTDANGAPITGLQKADFLVGSGSGSYPISWFRETSAATNPVSLLLIGDLPGSMWNKGVVRSGNLAQIRDTLEQAAEQMNECDEIGVVVAGGKYPPGLAPSKLDLPPSLGEATLIQPFTTDHDIAITKMYYLLPSGASRLPDAIRLALLQLGSAHYSSRGLVVLTDGLDQTATDEGAGLLKQARVDSVGVWVIGIGEPDAKTGMLSALRGTDRVDVAGVQRRPAADRPCPRGRWTTTREFHWRTQSEP